MAEQSTPRLIVGAPVANRAWGLRHWFECVAAQTRRPDGFLFVHQGERKDATWLAIERNARRHGFPVEIIHYPGVPHQRHDSERFRTLARLRNRLLTHADAMGADLFLSLDTDVMLENPDTIARLRDLVADGADIASPLAFLHPSAPRHWSPDDPVCWAYNAGWFTPDWWVRPHPSEISWGEQINIDIPMAVWLGNRRALQGRYGFHKSGEDIAYAHSARRLGLRVIMDASLYAHHVWSEADFHRDQLLAA